MNPHWNSFAAPTQGADGRAASHPHPAYPSTEQAHEWWKAWDERYGNAPVVFHPFEEVRAVQSLHACGMLTWSNLQSRTAYTQSELLPVSGFVSQLAPTSGVSGPSTSAASSASDPSAPSSSAAVFVPETSAPTSSPTPQSQSLGAPPTFVQTRSRGGPPHICPVCEKHFTRCVTADPARSPRI